MREDRSQDEDVPDDTSAYEPPDPRKQLSARVKMSIHAKLDAIVRFWRARAKADGRDPDEIDVTYVVERLLADKTDTEISKWGGLPPNEESWKKVLKDIESSKK